MRLYSWEPCTPEYVVRRVDSPLLCKLVSKQFYLGFVRALLCPAFPVRPPRRYCPVRFTGPVQLRDPLPVTRRVTPEAARNGDEPALACSNNDIGATGCIELAAGLAGLTALQALDLGYRSRRLGGRSDDVPSYEQRVRGRTMET